MCSSLANTLFLYLVQKCALVLLWGGSLINTLWKSSRSAYAWHPRGLFFFFFFKIEATETSCIQKGFSTLWINQYTWQLVSTNKTLVLQGYLCYWSFHEFGELCYWEWVLFVLPYYTLPSKKVKNKRHRGEKATTLWIYNVRVSLLFRVKFCLINAFLCVKLSPFLLLHLRLPESSTSVLVLSLFLSAGLGEESVMGTQDFFCLNIYLP